MTTHPTPPPGAARPAEHRHQQGSSPEQWFEGLDRFNESALDALPVGLIRLDREGRILHYNAAESQLSRRARLDVLGKNFFAEVAPCTAVQAFKGRFMEGVKNRTLFETFHFVFKFPWKEARVRITLFYSRVSDTVWASVEPEPESQ